MAVSFNQIPGNIRVPLFWAEVSAGSAPYQSESRLLLIGQKLSAGAAAVEQPILVTGNEDVLFGQGSMLAKMYKAARNAEPFNEIWCAPLADADSSTAATATITCTGPATVAGTIPLYIGGNRVPVNVTVGMTATQIAAAIVAAVTTPSAIDLTKTALECSAASTAGVVTLTQLNAGTVGNGVKVELALNADDGTYGTGFVTVTQFASGAGDPSVANVLANTGDQEFDFIASPYTDSTNMGLISSFLANRWGPYEGLYGEYVSYKDASNATLQTYGATLNDPNARVYGGYNFSTPVPVVAAVLGALHCAHLQSPPELSRPLHTLVLPLVRGPKLIGDRFTITGKNTLLYSGISTLDIQRDGSVMIGRAVTTYQTNAYGSKDPSFLSVNTRAQLQYGLRFLKQYVTSTYSRAALVDSNPYGLQNFITVDDIHVGLVHAYKRLVALGVFENASMFDQLLIVERDASDANRVNVLLNTDAVNQLEIFAVHAVSYLQFADAGV